MVDDIGVEALQAVLDTAHHLKIEMRSIVDEDALFCDRRGEVLWDGNKLSGTDDLWCV